MDNKNVLELQMALLYSEKIYLTAKKKKYKTNKALFLLVYMTTVKIWLTDKQMKRLVLRQLQKL